MSSELPNELLSRVLAAYDATKCPEPEERAEAMAHFNRVVEALLEEHPTVSRSSLLQALRFRYPQYRAAQLISQSRRRTV
jgi:hypothetical protein